MIDLSTINKIYISPGDTDLRMGIDGYAAMVEHAFSLDPFDNSIYLFCNKRHNKLKILHFDGTGFWLYYKRFETGTIKWPKNKDVKEINKKEILYLLDGIKMDQKSLPTIRPKSAL